ncbi:MAG: hypothetical protein JO035_17540 [Betaproteobacteria bacterium]|nr:hypothetical protein [Betaproteobacteria bacterium]
MQVRLGKEVARCPSCSATEFEPADPGAEIDEASELICSSCEAAVMRGDLILGIADVALANARRALKDGG